MSDKCTPEQKETTLHTVKKGRYWQDDLYSIILDPDYPGSVEVEKVKHEKIAGTKYATLSGQYHSIQYNKKKWPGEFIFHGDAKKLIEGAREVMGDTFAIRHILGDAGFTFDNKVKIWVPK